MPFDGLMMYSSAREMRDELDGARIERVMQPERDEIHIIFRNYGKNRRVLFCTNAENARVGFTDNSKANPPEPPMFCMTLRKHLQGGKLVSIEQSGFDRVLSFGILSLDDFGEPCEKKLIIECMGKHSNLILLGPTGRIIDSARRITGDISRYRQVLPGLDYVPPPQQDKLSPKDIRLQDIEYLLETGGNMRADKFISENIMGVSPASAAEMLSAAGCGQNRLQDMGPDGRQRLAEAAADILSSVISGESRPSIIMDGDGLPRDIISFVPYGRLYEDFDSAGAALDAFYERRDRLERIRQRSASIRQALNSAEEKAVRKAAALRDEISEAEKAEELRKTGELITANIYRIKRGQQTVRVTDYETGEDIDIELDSSISPADNAQRLFKKYAKAKNTLKMASAQLDAVNEELEYIESQKDALENASDMDELAEIREELASEGYFKASENRRRTGQPVSQPMRFVSDEGVSIYVGKNNTQNDYLTLRFASPEDIWMHAKDMPGSHVIIKAQHPSQSTLMQAASLAALYSRGKHSQNVPVDYAFRRYVKKPSGARPGKVIYTNQRTLFVDPDEKLAARLMKKTK